MKSRSRWFYYIILNIFISATVTGTVLFLYDRYQRSLQNPPVVSVLPTAVADQASFGDLNLEIVSVIGMGVADTEIVVLQNKGSDSVLLTDWVLKNGGNVIYTFPQVKMFKDGIVQVHSAAGANTPVDLYLGRNEPAWHSGDTAALYDTQGTLQATFSIP